MQVPVLPDESIRQAALDTRRSFHLEAPAGSGKTWLLTGRYLKLLAEVDHPHEILALTFTKKAAGEMRQRIRNLLDRAAAGTPPEEPAEAVLLEAAARANERQPPHRLAAADGLRIMTFHGFCLDLVQRAPVEAGIPPRSRMMSDEEQEQLRTQVAAATIRSLLRRPGDDPIRRATENRLLRLNNNWPSLQNELVDLLERRDQLEDLLELVRSHAHLSRPAAHMEERLAHLIGLRLEACLLAVGATTLGENWPGFVAHLHRQGAAAAGRLPEVLPSTSWDDLATWKEIASLLTTGKGEPRRQLGPAAGFYSGFARSNWAEAVRGLSSQAAEHLHGLKTLPLPGEAAADLEALYDLIVVVGEALRRYESQCRQRRLLDYVDLEQAALRLFEQEAPTDLQLFLDRRIKHLLVDEFQDTSRSQWRLVRGLCSGWSPGSPRSLFVVGDPKQSIYAFRKAEVSLFLKAKEGLPLPGTGRLPLENLELSANFRTHPRLVEWWNRLFARSIMTREDPEAEEVAYVAAEAMVRPSPPQLSLALFAEAGNSEDPRAAEAHWLAGAVRRELEHLSPGENIGILLFTRTHLEYYLKALQDFGVAVQVQEGLSLLEQREVLHLRQIAHALVRPQDDLAWAGLLRAPWSGLTLQQFVQVAAEPPASWIQKLEAAARKLPPAQRLWEAMAEARRRLGRDELAALVEGIWLELDGPEAVANLASLGGVANCRHFLDILARSEQGIPEETLEKAEISLRTAFAPVDPGAAPSPVEMMTVHKAKGLEFDVVFLPFLDWDPLGGGRGAPPPYLLERIPGGGHLLGMAPDKRRHEPGLVYQLLQETRARKTLAEAKRLFYVAVTRARRALHLSGTTGVKEGTLHPKKNSPLCWLVEHHRLHLTGDLNLGAEHEPVVDLYFNPEPKKPGDACRPHILELPEPLPFHPEPLPYETIIPSQLGGHRQPPRQEEDPTARARGVVTHRILQGLARETVLPGAGAVKTALLVEGIFPNEAGTLAESILKEVKACLQDPFLAWLLGGDHEQAYSEWALEDRPAPGQIRSGTIDRLVFDGACWWLVDYKTSRPAEGEGEEAFLQREAEQYRRQLLAYREMVAQFFGAAPETIRPIIYFTALQRKTDLPVSSQTGYG